MGLDIPKHRIKERQCYMNCFEVLINNMEKFKKNEYKVCIGYVGYDNNPNILYRHAYILDKDNNLAYDSGWEYLRSKPTVYNNVYIFDKDDYFVEIYENCIKGSSGYVSLDYLNKITKDADTKFIKENNLDERLAGSDIVILGLEIKNFSKEG